MSAPRLSVADALALAQQAAAVAAQLAVLAPQIRANWAAIEDAMGEADANKLRARIATAHEDVQALARELDALRAG